MHLPEIIRDLAVILGVAGITTLVFKKIKQPVVLGYLVAGLIVGPYTPPIPLVTDLPNIRVWAELGVIFLMFSLGLEFTFHKLVRVGTSAVGIAIIEVVGMISVGYMVGALLGWSHMDSLFLGGILSISSTTIIIKALDSLNLRRKRFADVVFGVLIVEDLVAILLLVTLSSYVSGQVAMGPELLVSTLKLLLVVGSWFLFGYFLIPRFLKYAARFTDNETLTVIAVGLCLLFVVMASRFHYSPALGAFIIGSILAETSDGQRIEHLISPLRDLFAAVFFVSVGMLMDPKFVWEYKGTVILISLVTIVGKIITSTLGALLTGQTIRHSTQIGFSLAQIGEFSFIIASLGVAMKVTSEFLYPVAVAASVITTFTTPYLIGISTRVATRLEVALPPRVRLALLSYSARHMARGAGKSSFRLVRTLLKGSSSAKEEHLNSLAPWDLHLVRVQVNPNSAMAGFMLGEANIRRRFDINILAIRRGMITIANPTPKDRLLPGDELLLLASDVQLEKFQAALDVMPDNVRESHDLSDYALSQYHIDDKSPLIGRTLQDSGIRENLGGLVVGMERDSKRSINPEPNTVLAPGDLLWIFSRVV